MTSSRLNVASPEERSAQSLNLKLHNHHLINTIHKLRLSTILPLVFWLVGYDNRAGGRTDELNVNLLSLSLLSLLFLAGDGVSGMNKVVCWRVFTFARLLFGSTLSQREASGNV